MVKIPVISVISGNFTWKQRAKLTALVAIRQAPYMYHIHASCIVGVFIRIIRALSTPRECMLSTPWTATR